MAGIWDQYGTRWERLRWARLRAGFERATDAATSLNIKPGTYRTYEYPEGEGGREPPLSELIRISKKYKVSWVWVATGEGDPDKGVEPDERLQVVSDRLKEIPSEQQDAAITAVTGVLDAFARKAG